MGTSRSLVFLWVWKRDSHSTVVFSVFGIVELYPSITSRKSGGLEALLFLANTASRRILWWTWIRCFFLFFTSSLVWWRISRRRCTKMVLSSSTCLLCSLGIFVGPQIWEVLKGADFEELLNLKELRSWEPFKSVCCGFLGNTRLPDYQTCIEKLLKSYEYTGCRMSLKIHFLHSHLNFFPPNLGVGSDEHGERFHQNITKMESNYQGKWNSGMMGGLCWMHLRDIPEAKYTRSSKKTLLTVCGTMNCVIVSSKYIDSISVLYLSCFICYKLLQLLKYAHIFSVYTKMRLFKSQKTRGDRAKLLINLNSAHPN